MRRSSFTGSGSSQTLMSVVTPSGRRDIPGRGSATSTAAGLGLAVAAVSSEHLPCIERLDQSVREVPPRSFAPLEGHEHGVHDCGAHE